MICFTSHSVEQAYVNQRKLETEAKQLQAHAGLEILQMVCYVLWVVRSNVFLFVLNKIKMVSWCWDLQETSNS